MTKQVDLWKSDFGDQYLLRNSISKDNSMRLTRDWGKMLSKAVNPSPQSVLEVGCNVGRNLIVLKNLVPELHGVEPNSAACKACRENPELRDVTVREGDGFQLPFPDSSIDMVFTSGVLIHVAPENLDAMIAEIFRVARHYILAIEYFSHQPIAVQYRGMDGFLFKRDFGGYYLEKYPNSLKVIDYGFLWQRVDSADNANWWLFSK